MNMIGVPCLALGLSSFSAAGETAPDPTYGNVSYGADERNVMDVWIPKGMDDRAPFPCVFYIHGGGWLNGDKSEVFKKFDYLPALLKEGYAVVSIHYRFISKHPFPAPMVDAARALQFVRSKAGEWNIHKDKFAVAGQSAGGCTALWLAFADDQADSKSADPVARESTRVSCTYVTQAQSTLDSKQLVEWTGNDLVFQHHMIKGAFGYPESAKDPDGILVKKYSPAANLGAGDPPVLYFVSGKESPPDNTNHAIHHPGFLTGLKALADKAGVSVEKNTEGAKGMLVFLKKHLIENTQPKEGKS